MNCDTCGTALTEFNATNYRHVHDVGNCAQVLLAQRDNARAALESDRALLRRIVADVGATLLMTQRLLDGPGEFNDIVTRSLALIDEARARFGQ